MSDIFQMDVAEEQYAQQHPTPSTSTSSSPILLEYAPKQQTTVLTSHHEDSTGIKTWLATHTSSYLPHDLPHPRGISPRRANPTRFALSSSSSSASDDDHDDHSDADSSDSDEEDAIFLQPRRHLSRQGSAQTSPVSRPALPTKKTNSVALHHHLHLTAQRPALPVVDLSAASGHLALDLDDFLVVPQLDKSHWSDDEDESAYSDADSEEDEDEDDLVEEDGLWALHPDELDVPALVEDEEGNPASTSTRSIPIPSPAPVAVARAGGRLRGCYHVESPPTRRKSMEGQSFWTPWMDQYLADAAAVAQAAR